MKRQSVAGLVVLIFIHLNGWAQQQQTSFIKPTPLGISDRTTTNLIFPYAIKSVDRGSAEVLVQEAQSVENVLQLKAATSDFTQTNLTVMTADGLFYSFIVNYAKHPAQLNIRLSNSNQADDRLVIFNPDDTNDKVRNNAARVLNKRAFITSSKTSSYKMQLSLKGIYAGGDMLYFQIGLKNNSWLDYPIRQLRLFIRDNKTAKRTASQEIEITPTYVLGNQKYIYNRSEQIIVIAIPAFTIPEKKKLLLQMQEANGGRHLQLAITNKRLTKAWRVF